ncbi:tRNA (uracil(54)-C(5))-methyltransferase [Grifola frondosa]|uniref:tRNA (Uracil(54)-C(5))-methyltransferase n=1 Tax=Grifola frondosa TaxID=5627 RepID=A0A1C7MNZ6_GRIFR|nr:tRNA (uracil(54)-C(5))-methyltransferase [Grifola frondosa]
MDSAVADETDWKAPFEQKEEVELVVSCLSSTGESLSLVTSKGQPWVVVTPLALPGETIRARIYRNARLHSYADLLNVVEPNLEWRDMTRVKCKYFGKCAGCQYQMLSYEKQLDLKRTVVVKAYNNYSSLPSSSIPPILPTIASPCNMDTNPHSRPSADAGSKPDWLQIGFNKIGTRHVIDIEECPIATPTLNKALGPLRDNIIKNIYTYKKGVSLLLRDSLEISSSSDDAITPLQSPAPTPSNLATTTVPETKSSSSDSDELSSSFEKHLCITDHKGTIRERVGDMLFEYTAGSFFQNSNSVLVPLTSYVHDAIFPQTNTAAAVSSPPTHLVDAYCGSGLFAITLSTHFEKVSGIELSADSIRSATRNAELNQLPDNKCTFLAGDASNIFATVQGFPRDKTALIIDPPRKGTDEKFIDQMLDFGCSTVVYVSCNVHTQARDVGMILRKSEEKLAGRKYVLESLRGFDLFPQTAHVESVAVLRLV